MMGGKRLLTSGDVKDPPIAHDEENLWLRVGLPGESWREPHIFIVNMRYGCEIYLGGRRVFYSGKMNEPSDTISSVLSGA